MIETAKQSVRVGFVGYGRNRRDPTGYQTRSHDIDPADNSRTVCGLPIGDDAVFDESASSCVACRRRKKHPPTSSPAVRESSHQALMIQGDIGMPCAKCAAAKTYVIDSRPMVGGVRRRRVCAVCGYRFSSEERHAGALDLMAEGRVRKKALDLLMAIGDAILSAEDTPDAEDGQ